jgi:peptidyl-prolyl cis-trans isomerase C
MIQNRRAEPMPPKRKRPFLAVFATLALGVGLLSACGEATQSPRPEVNAADALGADSEVVAQVNGKPIYRTDVLAEAVKRRWITVAQDLDPASPQFGQIVEDLIEEKLFAEEAVTQKLDQDPDVQRRLERAREIVLAQALRQKISAEVLSEDNVQRFYRDRNRQIPLGQMVRARIIVTAGREDAEAAKRLLTRGQTFAAVAFERSQDAETRAEGGDLGKEFLPESLPDGLRQAAQTTPVGEVAGPIQTPKGWYLIKVESRRQEEPPTLEQLRPEIQRWLVFDAMNGMYERLSATARIERLREDAGVALPPDAGAGDQGTEEPAEAGGPPPPVGGAPMGPGGLAGSAGKDLVKPGQAPKAPAPEPKAPAPKAAPPKAAPAPAPAQAPVAAPVEPAQ